MTYWGGTVENMHWLLQEFFWNSQIGSVMEWYWMSWKIIVLLNKWVERGLDFDLSLTVFRSCIWIIYRTHLSPLSYFFVYNFSKNYLSKRNIWIMFLLHLIKKGDKFKSIKIYWVGLAVSCLLAFISRLLWFWRCHKMKGKIDLKSAALRSSKEPSKCLFFTVFMQPKLKPIEQNRNWWWEKYQSEFPFQELPQKRGSSK